MRDFGGLSEAAFYERLLLVRLKQKVSRERTRYRKIQKELHPSSEAAGQAAAEAAVCTTIMQMFDKELAKYPKPLPALRKT